MVLLSVESLAERCLKVLTILRRRSRLKNLASCSALIDAVNPNWKSLVNRKKGKKARRSIKNHPLR